MISQVAKRWCPGASRRPARWRNFRPREIIDLAFVRLLSLSSLFAAWWPRWQWLVKTHRGKKKRKWPTTKMKKNVARRSRYTQPSRFSCWLVTVKNDENLGQGRGEDVNCQQAATPSARDGTENHAERHSWPPPLLNTHTHTDTHKLKVKERQEKETTENINRLRLGRDGHSNQIIRKRWSISSFFFFSFDFYFSPFLSCCFTRSWNPSSRGRMMNMIN